jgi:putative FmdB family regulatory protein
MKARTMPIYDFLCKTCDEEFETLVLGGRQPACPKCDGEELVKQPSTFAFRAGAGIAMDAPSASSSKCAGCAGGSCATCH